MDPCTVLETVRKSGENEVFEAKDKRTYSDDRMGEYFSALSNEAALRNNKSAWMIFGLADKTLDPVDSEYKDQPESLDKLKMFVSEFCDGMSYLDVQVHHEDGKRMVFFEIPAARPGVPTRFKRVAYERQGSSTVPMSIEKTKQIFAFTEDDWIDQPVEGVTVQDLDNYAFKMFKERGHEFKRISDIEMGYTTETFLRNLGLMHGSSPTRTAAILFGERPKLVSRAAYIRIGRVAKGARLLFIDELEGPMYTLIDRATDLIMSKYTVTQLEFKGLTRIEHYPYPPDAVREALLNAVVNSDYRHGDAIRVDVYDDSIRIYNSGNMPPGFTPKEVAALHMSKPRNKNMAEVFYRAYYVEKFGTGMEKLKKEYDEVGVKPPVYEAFPDIVILTMRDIVRAKGIAPTGAAGSLPLTGRATVSLTERQVAALKFIGETGEVTNEDLQEHMGLKREGVRTTVINPLMEFGLIDKINNGGLKRGQKYQLTENGIALSLDTRTI
jgi:ATP-dependent DNA helicase RecG